MTDSSYLRINRLATLTAVHRAFHWLHLHQPQLRRWLLEMVRIPAPPFGEHARAAWFIERFQTLGLTNVHLDPEGNALAEFAPEDGSAENSPIILISAHLDTVFPAGTLCDPLETDDDSRIHGPGVCDNAAGLSALLAMAAALRYAKVNPPSTILFAANVGEEGEGDLRGMRHLFLEGPYKNRIAAALALEGSGTAVVTRALGSLRFRCTIHGPGGHSWSDAGTPNPILLLSRALTAISELPLPSSPLTTLNVGHIAGGTSVNSIPASASALLELRSSDAHILRNASLQIRRILTASVAPFESLYPAVSLEIKPVGERPAGHLPDDSALLAALRGVDRHFSLRTELRLGSTDANLPFSLGIPALAIGTGGTGGNIHTLEEWYDPAGREMALRRLLLLLLAVTQIAPQLADEASKQESRAAAD
ncbi:M20/M25/M40 family metallo-hydrolase [Edaphobacter sp. 12200R-103]|uniref:M20/M25/M40 family metallo-hydrolase n=1 Tax=Edaphobacter sp. 12200R-103 TaxID=2703788 RepID=UPI00138B4A74|nr:M20/M25/M40 family metallo-hydrolase [Edaphobacter sp. 12200R-103]QHS51136.1 M20/M25/M40 family metallo-hydrolase [Edaphobacter sp. 12200R-103]